MLFVLAMAVTMILGGAKSFFTLQTLLVILQIFTWLIPIRDYRFDI